MGTNDEYISRQAMLNAVDKLAIIPSIDGMCKPTKTEDFRVQFLGTVLKVPAADVIHVVRCRECRFWDKDMNYCYKNRRVFLSHHYCAYGERK